MPEKNIENNQQNYKGSIFIDTLIIGFTGGILFSLGMQIAYFFNLLDFSPKFILTSWTNLAWVDGWLGIVMSVLLFGVLSILAALIYYALLKTIQSPFAGMLYGLLLWLLLLFILRPMFPDFPSYADMNAKTIITSVCLFILYGYFIGYSISYEHQEFHKYGQANSDTDAT